MTATESVSSFKGFSDVYPSCKKLTHELARLFDKCEFDKEKTHRHTISFREATERLRTAVVNSLSDVEIITGRKVSEFRIGKTSVTSQENLTFDPMKPMTWGEVGGTIGKWREHKKDNYHGLFEVGCVTNELIPTVIKETNTAIRMDHQMYALGMAQALVHQYMVHEPDGRLRNELIDFRNCSEGKRGDKGGIIYVAYKLEFGNIFEVGGLVINKEEQDVKTAIIEFLKIKLEEDGLHFHGSILDDGNSFFKAVSDQLQRLEIPGHTHTELRQIVIPTLKFCSENEIKSANFTSDTWKIYIDKVAKDKENVEDIVVETMAKLLRRQIIVYSRSYTNEISRKKFNEDANGTPLLLAKDKLYYQSLERRHDGTPSRLQESNTSKREEKERMEMERIENEEREYKEKIKKLEEQAAKQKAREIEIEERERRRRDGIFSSGGGDKSMGEESRHWRPMQKEGLGWREREKQRSDSWKKEPEESHRSTDSPRDEKYGWRGRGNPPRDEMPPVNEDIFRDERSPPTESAWGRDKGGRDERGPPGGDAWSRDRGRDDRGPPGDSWGRRDEKGGPPGDSWRDRGGRDDRGPPASSWTYRAAARDERGPPGDDA